MFVSDIMICTGPYFSASWKYWCWWSLIIECLIFSGAVGTTYCLTLEQYALYDVLWFGSWRSELLCIFLWYNILIAEFCFTPVLCTGACYMLRHNLLGVFFIVHQTHLPSRLRCLNYAICILYFTDLLLYFLPFQFSLLSFVISNAQSSHKNGVINVSAAA